MSGEPGNSSDTYIIYKIVPAVCIPIAVIDLILNLLLIVVHIRLKFWRTGPGVAYFNMLTLGSISSLAATALFGIKIAVGSFGEIDNVPIVALVLYHIEIFSLGAGLLSTFLMAMLRFSALRTPFTFVDLAQRRLLVPLILLSWVLGSGMAWLVHHYWDHDSHALLLYFWYSFLALTLLLFVVGLAALVPTLGDPGSRGTARKLLALGCCYAACFSGFGVMHVLRYYVCVEHVADQVAWLSELFCRYGDFITVIFVFPTINSIVNAVVISQADVVQEELQSWFGRSHPPDSVQQGQATSGKSCLSCVATYFRGFRSRVASTLRMSSVTVAGYLLSE